MHNPAKCWRRGSIINYTKVYNLDCSTYTSSVEKSLNWGIFTWRTKNLWRSPTTKQSESWLTCGHKIKKIKSFKWIYESMMTYETFFHFLAFASWLSGCFPPGSKRILSLLYYIPKAENNSEKSLLSPSLSTNSIVYLWCNCSQRWQMLFFFLFKASLPRRFDL